jgi:hypothetical protein
MVVSRATALFHAAYEGVFRAAIACRMPRSPLTRQRVNDTARTCLFDNGIGRPDAPKDTRNLRRLINRVRSL